MTVSISQIIDSGSIETLMQLIISPNTDFTAGVEALSRGVDTTDGSMISPQILFEQAREEGLLIELEKTLIQKAMEAFKPIHEEKKELLLFLNLSDEFLEYALSNPFLSETADCVGLESSSIVFDINPLSEAAMEYARSFVERYRALGFYMCIDDIGVDYHNMDKVLYLSPDMIKINIAAVRMLSNVPYQTGLIRYMKYMSDQMGILIVAKGIEDEADVQMTLDNGTQFMQGYFISKPVNLAHHSLSEIIERYREVMKAHYRETGDILETTRAITSRIISITKDIRYAIGTTCLSEMQQNSEGFFELYPFIENIWNLDKYGKQLNHTFINTQKYAVKSSPMFQIYNEGSDFSSKEIYRQLTDTILDVWVTRPYRSVLTNNLCVGCSVYAQEGSEDTILCVNFNYSGILEFVNSK